MSADIRPVVMPKWGLAMQEGTLAQWLAEAGPVTKGQEIAEIETSKITNVFESPADGHLRRRVAAAGETVPVGALLAVLAPPEVEDSELDGFIAKYAEEFAAKAAEGGADEPKPETVEADGARLQYLKAGESPGVPVLLIHGFGGDHTNWMFVQPTLAEGYTTYALDLPGHGGSAKALPEGGIAGLAGVILAFMDALGIERAHLVGHSLGGGLALYLATEEPDRVASATLVCPAGLGPEIDMAYIEGFIEAKRRKQLEPVLAKLFADPSMMSREMIEGVQRYKRLDGVDQALRGLAAVAFKDGRQATVLAARLASAPVPVQIVVGREDRIIPAAQAEAQAERVPVAVIDGAGHMVQMEKPAEVARLIADFLG